MVSVPVSEPVMDGLKLTKIAQVAFGLIVAQLLVREKSVLATILEIVIATLPVLRSVTSLDALVVLMA